MSEETEPLLGPANAAKAEDPGATPTTGLPDPTKNLGKKRGAEASGKTAGGDAMVTKGSSSVKAHMDNRDKQFANMSKGEVRGRLFVARWSADIDIHVYARCCSQAIRLFAHDRLRVRFLHLGSRRLCHA